MWCPTASLTVWANAWLAGRAAPDDVLDALSQWAPRHSVTAYDAAAADATGLPWPDLNDAGAVSMLQTLRTAAGPRTSPGPALSLVLPVPGDVRGLPAGTTFARDAVAAGEAIVVSGATGTPVGLVADLDYADDETDYAEPDFEPSPELCTVAWTVYSLPAAPTPEHFDLGDAEFALRSAVRSAADALGRLLDELGDGRPSLVRGDTGYGNEGILLELERRSQPYLLRLRRTANVQRLVAMQFARQDWSRPDSHGCQMVEDRLKLYGWSRQRRVVIVRQRIKGGIARERRMDGKQLKLDLVGPSVHEGERLWEYAVMVTDAKYPLEAMGQLYRDRADCENGFDELKNQWGASGFTAQDINRCQTTARACALVYNWCSWYCRAANPSARMEAITSRPLLLAAVGRAAHSGGQTTLYLTPMHGKANLLQPLIANIRAALRHVKSIAEQFRAADPWAILLRHLSNKIAPLPGAVQAAYRSSGIWVTAGSRLIAHNSALHSRPCKIQRRR